MRDLLTPPFVNRIDPVMSWDDYLSARGANPSRLIKGLKSMLSFRNYRGNDKPDRGMRVGSLTHCLTLEPDRFAERYAVFEGAFRENTKAYQTWEWKNPGKEPVKPLEYEQAARVADAVRSNGHAKSLLDAIQPEVSLFCEDHGVQCKGRVDGLEAGLLIDLKTTTNVEMNAFGRVFGTLHYAAKMACYKRWAEKLMGSSIDDIFVISVETKGDYDVAVVPIPAVILENAWPRVARILQRIPECIERDEWPGVAEGGLYELHVPNWSMDVDEVLDWSE